MTSPEAGVHPVRWWTTERLAADTVAAGLLALVVVPSTMIAVGSLPGGLVLGILACGPLVWRRTRPDLAGLLLLVPHLIQLALVDAPLPGNITVPIMVFSLASWAGPRTRPWWLAGAVLSAALAAVDWTGVLTNDRVDAAAVTFFLLASFVAASWSLGALARSVRDSRQTAWERSAAIAQQREQATLLTASEERQQIAREMHDVVAHSLAVIVVQADGGTYAASLDGDPAARLATAEKALRTIRETAQEALSETRRLVGVLRSDSGDGRAPSAGLGDVFDLVTGLSDAGRYVQMQVTGDPRLRATLGPGLELAAYRIIQEALTNTVKHAGPAARTVVTIDHAPDALTVAVRDDGQGASTTDGQGHGLVGMRERVAAFGGTLSAGNHPHGGFAVVARFPTHPGRTA